jgi:hypothetical protein
MTVARLQREMSGWEYAGWVALYNLREKERKAQEAKAKRGQRGRRR